MSVDHFARMLLLERNLANYRPDVPVRVQRVNLPIEDDAPEEFFYKVDALISWRTTMTCGLFRLQDDGELVLVDDNHPLTIPYRHDIREHIGEIYSAVQRIAVRESKDTIRGFIEKLINSNDQSVNEFCRTREDKIAALALGCITPVYEVEPTVNISDFPLAVEGEAKDGKTKLSQPELSAIASVELYLKELEGEE